MVCSSSRAGTEIVRPALAATNSSIVQLGRLSSGRSVSHLGVRVARDQAQMQSCEPLCVGGRVPWIEATISSTRLGRPRAPADRLDYLVHEVAATRRVLEMVASIQGTRPPTRTVKGKDAA